MRIYKAVVNNETLFVRATNSYQARTIVTERFVKIDLASQEDLLGASAKEVIEGMPDGSAPNQRED